MYYFLKKKTNYDHGLLDAGVVGNDKNWYQNAYLADE